MGICILGMGDCSSKIEQKSKTKMDLQNEFRESVNKRFNNNFSTKINNSSNQTCVSQVTASNKIGGITASGKGSAVNVGNDVTVDINCILNKMSTADFKSSLSSSLKEAMQETLSTANKSDFTGQAKGEMTLFGSGAETNQTTETDTSVKNIIDKSINETLNTDINNEINDKTFQELKTTISLNNTVESITATDGGQVSVFNKAAAKITGKFENTFVANAINTAMANTDVSTILDKHLDNYNKNNSQAEATGLAGLIESFGKALSSVIGALSLNNPLFLLFIGGVIILVVIILKGLFGGGDGDKPRRRRRSRRDRDDDDDD